MSDVYTLYYRGVKLVEIRYIPTYPGETLTYDIGCYGIHTLELPKGELVVDGRFPLADIRIEKNGVVVPLE